MGLLAAGLLSGATTAWALKVRQGVGGAGWRLGKVGVCWGGVGSSALGLPYRLHLVLGAQGRAGWGGAERAAG